MSSLQISQGTFRLSDTRTLTLPDLTLRSGESWAFVGANGSGKSALARALAGELTAAKGELRQDFQRRTRLSLEQLQKLVSDEWQRNNTDLLSPGEEDTGRTAPEIIQDEVKDQARAQALAEQFGISALLTRRFKYLSTGETRKTLLCQALMSAAGSADPGRTVRRSGCGIARQPCRYAASAASRRLHRGAGAEPL